MALAPVTLPEWLRPWHGAGLRHLLAEAPPNGAAVFGAPSAVRSVAARQEGDGSRPAAEGRAAPSISSEGAAPTGAAVLEPATDLADGKTAASDIRTWPPAWQRLWSRSAAAPVLWTYHELGLDLSGQGEPARGALFRRLLATLRLPKGTSVFWPTALPTDRGEGGPDAASPAVETGIFWAGAAMLHSRVIVAFGAAALRDMGLDADAFPLFQQRIVKGKWIAPMPDITHLLAEEARLAPTLSFLQAVLTPLLLV